MIAATPGIAVPESLSRKPAVSATTSAMSPGRSAG